MKFPDDSSIFKYCSLDVGEKIISSQSLKFNNPSFFNDPFDCDINLLKFDFTECCDELLFEIEMAKEIAMDITLNEYPSINKSILERTKVTPDFVEEDYKKIQINKINKTSICCFSKNYTNMTMWSHYADKHHGVCLVFDYDLTERFEDPEINRRMNFGTVEYKELQPYNYLKSKQEGLCNLFFTKAKDWSYEEEVRFFILERDLEFIRFNRKFLKGVIFGANVTDEEIEKFKVSLCSEKSKQLKFARLRKDKLELKFEDLQ